MKKRFTTFIRQSSQWVAIAGKTTAAAMLLMFGLWSCDPNNEEDILEIVLTSPDNNATVDLSTVDNITFSWEKAEGVANYTLRFSTSESGAISSDVKLDVGDNSSYVLPTPEIEQMMAEHTPVAPGESGSIYWTVTGGEASPQVRQLTIKRRPAEELYLNPHPNNVTFAATPTGPQTVTISANTAWTAAIIPADTKWFTITPSSGNGDGQITLTATTNTTTTAHTAAITFTGTGLDEVQAINVTQAAAGGGSTTGILGTWHLKKAQEIRSQGDAKFTREYIAAESFTLNEDGTFEGDIIKQQINEWADDGSNTKTWRSEGGLFTFVETGILQVTFGNDAQEFIVDDNSSASTFSWLEWGNDDDEYYYSKISFSK